MATMPEVPGEALGEIVILAVTRDSHKARTYIRYRHFGAHHLVVLRDKDLLDTTRLSREQHEVLGAVRSALREKALGTKTKPRAPGVTTAELELLRGPK